MDDDTLAIIEMNNIYDNDYSKITAFMDLKMKERNELSERLIGYYKATIYDNEYLIQEEKTSIALLVGNILQLYSLPIEQGDYLVLENNELIYYTKTKDKITFYKLK